MTLSVPFSGIEMTKLVSAALVGTVLSLLIKDKAPKISFAVSAVCGVLILSSVIDDISEIVSFADGFSAFSGSEIFSLLLKATGLAYIVDFAADLCRDAGETGNAKRLENAGKIAILALSLPVITGLFDKVKDIFS